VQALAILFGALFTIATCLASGRLLLRGTSADAGIAFVTGAAALSLAVFGLCAIGAVFPGVFLALGVGLIAVSRPFSWFARGKHAPWRTLHCAVFALFLLYFVVYLCHAMAPEASPDGTTYHLSLVSQYFRGHGFHRITTNIYANLSQGIEMLFLFAFAFGQHSAAALVHLAFLLALVWQMYHYGRESGFALAGVCAAFLVFASPVVGIDAASAYNDVAVAAIAFTLFRLLAIWDQRRELPLLVAIGLVAGFAYAAKYTAALAIPYAVGYVAWKSRRMRDVALVAGCAALLVIPWMAKDWIWVGNPLSPFFNHWFPNQYVTISFEKEYRSYLTHYDLFSPWQIPLQATTYGKLSGSLGPVFLLAPIAVLGLLWRPGRHLWLATLVFGIPYFTNIGTRFLIPPLPFVALLMALVLSRVPMLAVAVLLVHAVLSWPSIVPKYARDDAWRFHGIPWREALRLRSSDAYLERRLPNYGVVRMIESQTQPGSTVFTIQPIPEAYTTRRVIVQYQSAEGEIAGRILQTGALPEYAPTLRLTFPFTRQSLQAVRVVQGNTGSDLWTIQELLIFDGTRELPRKPEWRLRARPYPWTIQDAFDNSLVTFWSTGESLRPGMFVEVNFGASIPADAVGIETAPNQWQVHLRLEGEDSRGQWKLLASAPQQTEEARPIGLRKAVAAELKRRGIDYLLLFDRDDGAADLRRNPARWGIRQVGAYQDARLYAIP
jgi:hypothetical protein